MVTRIVSVLLALVLGAVAGFAVCDSLDRDMRSELVRENEALVRETADLRSERDRLASVLAENKRAMADLHTASEAVRIELEDKLARLEQLVAALVGTRPAASPAGSPAADATPAGGEVREPN